jgi:Family of unknown function (DUF6318)
VHRPGPRRWAATRMGLGVAALALIAGCSTPDPTPPPSSTTSPVGTSSSTTSAASSTSTATGSATTGASDLPEPARANTPEGAVAFTEFFFANVNQAYKTLDDKHLSALSEASCQGCSIIKETISGWKNKNYHFDGEFATPTSTTIAAFPEDSTAKVLLLSKTQGSKLLDASNSTVQTFPPDSTRSLISLKRSNDAWKVAEIKAAA